MKDTLMDKRTLETIFLDQKAEIENKKGLCLCPRYEESLIDLNSPQAQVVIGVRRSGKSTLCMQALIGAGVNFAYADFDDERLAGLSTDQLNDALEVLYKIYGDFTHLFLDEIQNVEGWPLFVNRLLRNGMRVILTGSNAKLLSNELATHLTGRSSEIALYPFSFTEYCDMTGTGRDTFTTKAVAGLRGAFDDYLKRGGFPELLRIKDAKRYITNLVDNILKRDIEQRYKLSFPAQFERMAHHLLNVSPNVVSIAGLSGLFDIKSPHTVRGYIKYLKEAYLLVGIQKYSPKSKVRLTGEKLYAVDVAMMNRRENAFSGENLGWRLETAVLNHLVRKCRNEGWDIYYLKERSGECDFIVCDGNRTLQCIQVSYDISSGKTLRREIDGLLLAAGRTGCENLLLLTDFEYREMERDGHHVRIRPVYEWCAEMFGGKWDRASTAL